MIYRTSLLIFSSYILCALSCTLIVLGPQATSDGSSMAIQTNDCIDCDFRINVVPRMSHSAGDKVPVWTARFAYPRYVGSDRGDIYHLEDVDRSIFPWNTTSSMGYIDQVPSTYGYLDGSYPIINDHQVGFAESTCSSRLVNVPLSDGGGAMFDVTALMRIAAERTTTARAAIRLMGKLAVEYGYYGAEWTGNGRFAEAGEALGVTDTKEAWMFHVSPDDTGKSAVWVAQRVPDDHISVVANEFVIHHVDLTDEDKFMGSDNMEEVALRAGLWKKEDGSLSEGTFDFAHAYSVPSGHMSVYTTRRVWRVYDLTAPSLQLPAHTDERGSDYPFSAKPDALVSQRDVMRILRDHYEGTEFDLSKGLAAGDYNDPNRYDTGPNEDGVTRDHARTGLFERSIALFRTSYSFIAQSRADKPAPIGPMAWLGFYAPDASVYLPFYAAAPYLDKSVSVGSSYKVDRESAFWAHAATGNYANRFYRHTYDEIREIQDELESRFIEQQEQVEREAVEMLKEGGTSEDGVTGYDAAARHLADFSAVCARTVLERMWDCFDLLLSKYKDGYRLDDPHAETYKPVAMFYPLEWLEQTDFFFNNAATKIFPCERDGEEALETPEATMRVEDLLVLMMLVGYPSMVIGRLLGAWYQRRNSNFF